MITICEYTAEELIDNKEFDTLVREYATYNRLPNTDAVANFDLRAYLDFDCAPIAVLKDDEKMVGLMCIILEKHMHTNELLFAVDSYFIKPEYRKNGNADKLMQWAKDTTRARGVKNLICSAYHGTEIEKVFFRKYKPLETWFIVEI